MTRIGRLCTAAVLDALMAEPTRQAAAQTIPAERPVEVSGPQGPLRGTLLAPATPRPPS